MEDYFWLISLIGSIGAIGAALAAWRAAREARNSTSGQLLMRIADSYGSEEMLKGIRDLSDWRSKHGSEFARIFGEYHRTLYSKVDYIDKARRRYKFHFHKMRHLYDSRVVSKAFLRKTTTKHQVNFLLDIVEPLEKVIADELNREHERDFFDFFKTLYK